MGESSMYHAKVYRERNKAYWLKRLGGKCVDCGYADSRALSFDHVDPASKSREITALITRRHADDPVLVAEMAKCVIRCLNCHFIKGLTNQEHGRRRKPRESHLSALRSGKNILMHQISA